MGSSVGPDSTMTAWPCLRARRCLKPRWWSSFSTCGGSWFSARYCGMGAAGLRGLPPRILDVIGAPGPAERMSLDAIPVGDERLHLGLLVVAGAEVPARYRYV